MIRNTALAMANAPTPRVAIAVALRRKVTPNPKNGSEVHNTRMVTNGQDIEFVICSVICSR